MSKEKMLELEQFTANSFMGIDKSSPIFIDFSQAKKNQNIIEFFGNQGTRKSSTLHGILYAMAGKLPFEKKKLLNSLDNELSEELIFTWEGERYKAVVKTERIELRKQVGDKWKPEDEPVAMIKKIFGSVGLSPFALREMDGNKQIEYMFNTFGKSEETSKKIKKTEADLKIKFNERTEVNRELKAVKNSLEIEPLFQDYEKSQKRFEKTINAEKEKAKYDELSTKKTAYEKYQHTLEATEGELKDKDEEIERLEKQLQAAKDLRQKLQESVDKGKKWVETNKGIIKEYETANAEWLNLSKTLADQEKWKDVLKKEKNFNTLQEQSVDLDASVEKLREDLLKLTSKCLPPVEGLTIKVATGIDKTGQQEGVFYNDQAIHELSESEYIDLWCKIWEAAGTKFIFIENISSLGSDVVNTLNQLVKNGGTVFVTRMDRGVKEMGFSFLSKIS